MRINGNNKRNTENYKQPANMRNGSIMQKKNNTLHSVVCTRERFAFLYK